MTALETYDLTSGSLRWSIPATLPELLLSHDAVEFTRRLKVSPDGTTLCAQIRRKSHARDILIIDAREGRIITKRFLTDSNGDVPAISKDNTKVAVFNWGWGSGRQVHIKVFHIDAATNKKARADGGGTGPDSFNMIPIPKLRRGDGMVMSFAPDSEHIITCEGPVISSHPPLETPLTMTIRVYRCVDGALVSHIDRPGAPPSSSPFYKNWQHLAMRFHYPKSPDGWLVSFPDYTTNSGKTCIMDAKTGDTVALLSTERSLLQTWQSGLLPPSKAEVTFDDKSGLWTRMELTTTLLPPGQTATVTKFELPPQSTKDGRAAAPPEVVVLGGLGADDILDLSGDGTLLAVRRAATHQVDVFQLS